MSVFFLLLNHLAKIHGCILHFCILTFVLKSKKHCKNDKLALEVWNYILWYLDCCWH